MINRSIAPPINNITDISFLQANKQVLPNGTPLYFINSGYTDLIKIEFMFAAGNWYQPEALIAFATNSALMESTQSKSSSEIIDAIEFYGASYSNSVDKDNAYISILTMNKHLPRVLPILSDILNNASFPASEIEKFKQKHKQQYLIEQTKVSAIARVNHNEKLFGTNHPYGYMIKPEDFEKITPSALSGFYKDKYHSKNCSIIASGKVTDSDIKEISKYFGDTAWGEAKTSLPFQFPKIETKGEKIFIEKPDAVQNALRIGKVIVNKTHADYAGLSVLNCILGGYFGSRLMKKIREEKGFTYGINSLLVSLAQGGFFTIVSEVGSDVTAEALADIYNEIEILRTQPVLDEELQRVKNYMMGDMVRMFDGPFAQAENLISLLEYNIGYEHFTDMKNKILTITSAELLQLAQTYLDPASFVEVVAGKSF